MNEKERLLRALKGEKVDRPPVICPGGMMSACVTEVLETVEGNHHNSVEAMVVSAQKIHELTGFENLGVPYCITAEPELFGIGIDLGDKKVEPRITYYNEDDLDHIMEQYTPGFVEGKAAGGRIEAILDSIAHLKNDDLPVIGNVSGHISTATSVVDPLKIFRMLRKDPAKAYAFFKYINDFLIEYAREMIKAGADVIAISDPTASGEILGVKNFETFAAPFYLELIKAIDEQGVPVIIHICGNAKNSIELLNQVGARAVSFDSIVNMGYARPRLDCGLMGNVSTQLLHTGEKDKIISITRNAVKSGVDIVSPACGLSMATPVANLKAMTDYVKEGNFN